MSGRFRNDMHYSRSSFARSFFQAGPGDSTVDALDETSEELSPPSSSVPVPQSRPPRPLARRASSRGAALFRSTSVGNTVPGVADSAAGITPAGMNDYNNIMSHVTQATSGGPINSEVDRSASWYTDAVKAGFTSSNLHEFLDSTSPVAPTPKAASANHHDVSHNPESAFGDEEVLEQYRIMAQHEAMIRVKENTGFDPEEYERRRKLHPPENSSARSKKNLYGGGKKPQARLPPLKKITPSNISLKLEEPPMPPPRVNNYFLQQSGTRVSELCIGVAVRGSNSSVAVGKDDHIVRCLGCSNQLRVKILATLVSCPTCNTVSPASSTRR